MAKQRLELTWYNKDKALIPTENGRYGYMWVEPTDPRYCETHTLIYDDYVEGTQSSKSDNFEYSARADLEPQIDNLLIQGESGDVLEALTRVPEFANKYVGKVKLVYIDPPFNTAKTFASYEDNLEHSIWLTMMRDRLINLKKLLSDDGSIWVHLDDVEVHRMRLLLDEVFGSDCFQAEISWEKADGPRNNTEGFSKDCDPILVYAKTNSFSPKRMERTISDNARFSNPDGDPNGAWWDGDPTARHAKGKRQHPSTYGIQHPVTGEMAYPGQSANWYYAQETMLKEMRQYGAYEIVPPDEQELEMRRSIEGDGVEIRNDIGSIRIPDWNEDDREIALQRYAKGSWPSIILRGKDGLGGGLGLKAYIPNRGTPPRTHWSNTDVGHNRSAKTEIKKLFPNSTPFSTPKPERLLERIIHIGSNPGDVILDCFAGSGTTPAVAQKMGRKWVACELLESNFNTFTRPRLEMVVKDQDPGGVTLTSKRSLKDKAILPDGFNTDELFKSTQLLNKLKKEDTLSEEQKDAINVVNRLIATSPSKTLNWCGGGGFQVAHLSPSCFDYDAELNRVILTEDATGQVLVKSVAANLGFRLLGDEEDHIFDGKRGRMYLKVYEGIADINLVDNLLTSLDKGESLMLATTGLVDGVREHLRRARKGSRIVHVPDDIFAYSKEYGDE